MSLQSIHSIQKQMCAYFIHIYNIYTVQATTHILYIYIYIYMYVYVYTYMHITYIDSSKLYGSLPQEEYDFWRRAAHGAAPLDAVDYQGPRSAEGGAMPTCHQRQL